MSEEELELGIEPAEPEAKADFVVSARKYRPQTFSDLTGQHTVARALSKAINENRLPHALLFSGPRGVGKTTSARILAKALNCEEGPTPNPCGRCRHCVSITSGSDLDVVEIDGASNNGVDSIRELRERVNYSSFSASWKVYIIDEVHMLSQGAFNALLKTLEEPPPRVIFIFATTEPDKVPQTIRSRCGWYQFGRISAQDIAGRLAHVVDHEEAIRLVENERDEILLTIAQSAEGGMRDALVTLDQLTALCENEISLAETRSLLGLVEQGLLIEVFRMLIERDTKGLLEKIHEMARGGQDFERFAKSMCRFLRDLMIIKTMGEKAASLLDITADRLEQMDQIVRPQAHEKLLQFTKAFLDLEGEMKTTAQPRILMEYTMIKLTVIDPLTPLDQMMRRLEGMDPDQVGQSAGQGDSPGKPGGRPTALRDDGAAAEIIPVESAPAPAAVPDSAPLERIDTEPAASEEPALEPAAEKIDPEKDPNRFWEMAIARVRKKKASLARSMTLCRPDRVEKNRFIVIAPADENARYEKSQIESPRSAKALSVLAEDLCGRALEIAVVMPEPGEGNQGGADSEDQADAVDNDSPSPLERDFVDRAAKGPQADLESGIDPDVAPSGESDIGGINPPSSFEPPSSGKPTDSRAFDQDMPIRSNEPAEPPPDAYKDFGNFASDLTEEQGRRLRRKNETPKQKLERLRKENPEFAKALDTVIDSVNGMVTTVDDQPIR